MKFNEIPTWMQWQKICFDRFSKDKNKIYLVQIDQLLKQYPGGAPNTNLHRQKLVQLRNVIGEARDDLSRIADKATRNRRLEVMHALDDVAQQKLKERQGPKYDYVVFIAYLVNTGKVAGMKAVYYTPPPSMGPHQEDPQARCNEMAAMIDKVSKVTLSAMARPFGA